MKVNRIIIIACIAVFLVVSCTKQNEEHFQSQMTSNCDTSKIKFSLNVLPIIQANCYSCHGNGRKFGGIDLNGFDKIKFQAINSDLLQVINHSSGYPAMPPNKPKLSSCDIDKITSWVNHGGPDN